MFSISNGVGGVAASAGAQLLCVIGDDKRLVSSIYDTESLLQRVDVTHET